jgi:hypothetical protein
MDTTATVNAVLPPLLCKACGVLEVPCISADTGPHVARADCAGCGRFIKWLPRVLVYGKEDAPTMGSLNILIVSGVLDRMPRAC